MALDPLGTCRVMWLVLWLLLADGPDSKQANTYLFTYLHLQSEPLLLLKDAGLFSQDLG